VALSFISIRKAHGENKQLAIYCAALMLGTIYTFFTSGALNGHYLIQVFPFVLILVAGILIRRELRPRLVLLSLFILAISYESITEYYRLAYNYSQHSTLYNGKAFHAVSELKARNLDNKKIYFTSYHIGYWLLHQYPLTKSTTHPSSLNRPYLFKYMGTPNRTSIEELKYVLENIRPEIIVSGDHLLHFFAPGSEENNYFTKLMKEQFMIVYENPTKRVVIWQRKGI
jgi:hypothetical protein